MAKWTIIEWAIFAALAFSFAVQLLSQRATRSQLNRIEAGLHDCRWGP